MSLKSHALTSTEALIDGSEIISHRCYLAESLRVVNTLSGDTERSIKDDVRRTKDLDPSKKEGKTTKGDDGRRL